MIKASKTDTDNQMIIEALGKIKTPKNLPINHPGQQLSSVWSELRVDNNLGLIILNGNRIDVPKSERKNLLQLIHASHCGTGKSNWRAKELYFWRGMNSEINALVHNCEICRPFLPSQGKQQIIQGTTATGQMTDLGTDLFQIGHNHYLVLVDRYSGFPFVEKLTNSLQLLLRQGRLQSGATGA